MKKDKKAKRSFLALLSILLMLFVATIWVFNYQTTLPAKTVSADTMIKNDTKSGDFDPNDLKPITQTELLAKGLTNFGEYSGIGSIVIPSISLALPIYKGFSGNNQYLGACTGWEDQVMGSGNYVLYGHNGIEGYLFSHLKDVALGDAIYTTDGKNVYYWKAAKTLIVDQSEVGYVTSTPREAELTLVTCHGGDGTIQRFVAIGKLYRTQAVQEAPAKITAMLGIDTQK